MLTQENLEEFTRRNSELEEKRYSHSSPYYKGLTDFSLVLGREKNSPERESPNAHYEYFTSPYYKGLTDFTLAINRERDPASTSPGRESHAGSFVSSSSRTSFAVKMQEWGGSCFMFNSEEEKTPTIIKVYSTEPLNKGPLGQRGSITSPPPILNTAPPPLSPPKSPPPPSIHEEEPISLTKRLVLNEKEKSESKEEKYFWADNYRPQALKDFICNRDKASELTHMAKAQDCHHFIFEGQPGVGKRTMIWAFLREAFGADKVQAREKCKTFDLKGEAISSTIVNVKESSQHVEVNLSELKGYEKHVIVELIKETNNRLANNGMQRCNHDNCRDIILYEADKLSTDALLYIRWLLERYRGCNKIFFCCNDVSKLQPIKSLCNVVQLFPPSNEEIIEVLEFIAEKEGTQLPHQLAERIVNNSKNNLRQAIRSFEATWRSNPLLTEDQVIMTGWEDDIADIAKNIVEKRSPKQLYDIRRKLQNLIEHTVSPEFIFETLAEDLKKHVDEPSIKQIEKMYKEYSGGDDNEKLHGFERNRQTETNRKHNDPKRKIIHQFMSIEEFIAKFMSYYKGWLAKKADEETSSQRELGDVII